MKPPPPAEVAVTATTLPRIAHPALRAEAAAALGRGERVLLVTGGQGGSTVETVVLASGLAAQSAGESVIRGEWKGGRLVAAEGGHLLDADGFCFCRSCEMAGGYCADDDG